MPIQHIALLRFKPGTATSVIDQTFQKLRGLPAVIPGITGFTGGANNSPEGLADGLTHAFVMTFASGAARDAYLPHPEHEKFKAFAVPHLDRVVVIDYES
jgi:hypothetical protein